MDEATLALDGVDISMDGGMLTAVTTDWALRGFMLAQGALPPASMRQSADLALGLIRRSLAAARTVQAGVALAPAGAVSVRPEAGERLSRFVGVDDAATAPAVAMVPPGDSVEASRVTLVASDPSMPREQALSAAVAAIAPPPTPIVTPAVAQLTATARAIRPGRVAPVERAAVASLPLEPSDTTRAASPNVTSVPQSVRPRLLVERLQSSPVPRTQMLANALPESGNRTGAGIPSLAHELPIQLTSGPETANDATIEPSSARHDLPDARRRLSGTTAALLPRPNAARYSVTHPAMQGNATTPAPIVAAPDAGAQGVTSAPSSAPANDADPDTAMAQRMHRAAAEAEAVMDLERRLEAIMRADLQRHGIDF